MLERDDSDYPRCNESDSDYWTARDSQALKGIII